MIHVSRWVYQFFVAPIPAGMEACHICDNPVCVNPDHIFIGTHADNMADMKAKNRQAYAGLTTCLRGHERSEENVYMSPNGYPTCRQCRRMKERERYAAKRLTGDEE